MSSTELTIFVPALAALAGAFIGSIAPVVVGLINARSESRRERLPVSARIPIEPERLYEVQINLHAFVINLSGIFDNYAWSFIYEHWYLNRAAISSLFALPASAAVRIGANDWRRQSVSTKDSHALVLAEKNVQSSFE